MQRSDKMLRMTDPTADASARLKNSDRSVQKAFVIFFLLCISAFSIWPLPLNISRKLPAPFMDSSDPLEIARNDPFMFCWNLYWCKNWLTGLNPLYDCKTLQFPFGCDLNGHTLSISNGIMAAPLLSTISTVTAHNILLLLHALLTGIAIYFCLRSRFSSSFWSLACASIAILWPSRTVHSLAHLNLASTSFFAFFVWIISSRMDRSIILKSFFAAFMIFCAALSDWHFLLFAFLTHAMVCAARVLSERSFGTLSLFFGAWVIASIILIPFIYPLVSADRSWMIRSTEERESYSLAPLSILLPSPLHPVVRNFASKTFPLKPENCGTMGATCFILGILIVIRGNRMSRLWLLIALIFYLFSLGPSIQIMNVKAPMPYRLLEWLPQMSIARTPGRFWLPAGIFVALALGHFLSEEKMPLFKKPWAKGLIAGLVLFEYWPVPIPLASAETPAVYQTIKWRTQDEPDNNSKSEKKAVLDVPADWTIRAYQFYQVTHGQPIAMGFVSRMNPGFYYRFQQFPLLHDLSDESTARIALETADPVLMTDLRHLIKFRYLAVHKDLIAGGGRLNMSDCASRYGAVILEEDSQTAILDFPGGDDEMVDIEANVANKPRCYFYENWHSPEIWSGESKPVRWAGCGKSTVMVFAPRDCEPLTLRFTIRPAPLHGGQTQNIRITIDGRDVWEDSLLPDEWRQMECDLPGPFFRQGSCLAFDADKAIRPVDLGYANETDARNISFAIQGLEIVR